MPSAPLNLSEQARAVHAVLGFLLFFYSGFGVSSNEFFAVPAEGRTGSPIVWFMLAAMLCGIAVLASVCAASGEGECTRYKVKRDCMLLFQSIGWILFFSAAIMYIHTHVLS